MSAGKSGGRGGRSVKSIAVAFACLVYGATLGGPASAGSFKVNPVHISLPADRQSASLKITNSDAEPVSVRIVTYAWSQIDGRDLYKPTTDVIVSPPIFTIPPGQMQILRIGLRSRGGAGAYRVILEEIPREKSVEGQVQVTLRLNLPLYLVPRGGGKAELGWTMWRDGAGDMIIEGRNRGSLHGQVLELAADHHGVRTILSTQMGVVLPGSARQWNVGDRPGFLPGAPLLLTVKGSAGETQAQVVLERR